MLPWLGASVGAFFSIAFTGAAAALCKRTGQSSPTPLPPPPLPLPPPASFVGTGRRPTAATKAASAAADAGVESAAASTTGRRWNDDTPL